MKTKKIKKIAVALLSAAMITTSAVAVLPANAAQVTSTAVSASLTINSKSVTLGQGETYNLSPNKSASFKSSNTKTATVDKNGKITAKANGTATITATSGSQKSTCKVTVKPAPTSVKLNTGNFTVGVGETYTLSESTNSGSYAKSFSWSSSNSKAATVTKGKANKAEIKAVGTGTANITIKTYNGKTATVRVTVKPAPKSVKLNTGNFTVGVGETYTISESTNSGSYAKSFSWSSSNTKAATVQKTSGNKAKITAKNTGTANISIKTYNGKTATIKVTVKPAPKSVKLNTGNFTVGVGETYTISESTNSGSYAKSFSWNSSDTNVVTVTKGNANKAGIKAVGTGTANITIKTYNGKTAKIKVTVKPAPDSIKLSKSELTLGVGEKYTISESTNSGSYAKRFAWSSSNSKVATVTKGNANKAEIKAVGKGTAIITIKTYNGKTAACTVTVPGMWHDAEYKTVSHPAETKEVWVVDEEAYTYEEPIYEEHNLCKGCIDKASELASYRIWDLDRAEYYLACMAVGVNPNLDVLTSKEDVEHGYNHIINGENDGWFSATVKMGTKTITVPEVGHYETVVVKEAWTESVLVKEAGYY